MIYAARTVEQDARGVGMADRAGGDRTGGDRTGDDRTGLAARRAAARLLAAVLGGRTLPEALADPGALPPGLSPADRARAQRLATTALRQAGRIDRVLDPVLRKAPPPEVHAILRVAVAELAVDRAAAHGVVDAAVTAARGLRTGAPLAGLVNAVLRKVAAMPDPFAGLPPPVMPPWLRRPLIAAWGKPAVQAMEAVHAAPPPVDLTLRPGALPPPQAGALPTGSWRLPPGLQVSALPGHDEGDWWVQDAAAALPARMLGARPGESVLDLCAAPGGKTMQLAAARARVTALDASAARMARLRENLARTGLSAEAVVADALDWQPQRAFDAILLDAPCSATGTLRRHPDLPFAAAGRDLPGLAALQARLLDRALGWLAPGGRLVFCTCSLLPEEGEGQLAAALARHPGLAADPVDLPGADPAWAASGGGLRIRPDHWADRGGIDGFFMVRLRHT